VYYFVCLCVTSWLKIREAKVKKVMFLVILSLLLLAAFVWAENPGTLEGVLVPEMIQVSGDELYVLEGATIYVYSLKDLKLLCKFGQKGEGPGELKIMEAFPNNFSKFYAIDKDRFVYLVENQEEEEWEVHVLDIK